MSKLELLLISFTSVPSIFQYIMLGAVLFPVCVLRLEDFGAIGISTF